MILALAYLCNEPPPVALTVCALSLSLSLSPLSLSLSERSPTPYAYGARSLSLSPLLSLTKFPQKFPKLYFKPYECSGSEKRRKEVVYLFLPACVYACLCVCAYIICDLHNS
jgi:hypothetical protein